MTSSTPSTTLPRTSRQPEDPRLPQGEGADAGARLRGSARSGSTPRRSRATSAAGSATPRSREAHPPGRAARVRVRPAIVGRRETFASPRRSTVQPKPEVADWTKLEVPRAEAEVPEEMVDGRARALRDTVAELVPVETGRRVRATRRRRHRPRRRGERDYVVELGARRLSRRSRPASRHVRRRDEARSTARRETTATST